MEFLRSEIEEMDCLEHGRGESRLLSDSNQRNYNSINSHPSNHRHSSPSDVLVTTSTSSPASPGNVFLSPQCQTCAKSVGQFIVFEISNRIN